MGRLVEDCNISLISWGGATPTQATAQDEGSETLVVVIGDTIVQVPEGWTSSLDQGVRTYQEYELNDADGTTIGDLKFHGVSTLDAGTSGWYANERFTISGLGVIEGISSGDYTEVGGSIVDAGTGVIVGGTGAFEGINGVYSYADDLVTITLTYRLP